MEEEKLKAEWEKAKKRGRTWSFLATPEMFEVEEKKQNVGGEDITITSYSFTLTDEKIKKQEKENVH